METDSNYNGLYPVPDENLCKMLKSYLECGGKLKIGDYGYAVGKRLFYRLIVSAVALFKKYKCNGCSGSHQYCIAGGYASYLAGFTDCFGDIDVFIHCNKKLEDTPIYLAKCNISTFRNVSTVHNKLVTPGPNIQFIQVNFDIGATVAEQQSELFKNMMSLYVVARFDLPICRVAVRVISVQEKLIHMIDATSFNIYKTPSSEERLMKYEERKIADRKKSVPSLQLCGLFALINKFC